jgi:hypothetical protein
MLTVRRCSDTKFRNIVFDGKQKMKLIIPHPGRIGKVGLFLFFIVGQLPVPRRTARFSANRKICLMHHSFL